MNPHPFGPADVLNRSLDEIKLNPRLRKQLGKAGYATLSEALEASDEDMARSLSGNAYDSWCLLLDRLEESPAEAAEELTAPLDLNRLSEIKQSMAIVKDDAIATSSRSAYALPQSRSSQDEKALNPLPTNETTLALSKLERLANNSLAALADHRESALVAECFPSLTLQLDEIEREIVSLFRRYGDVSSKALTYARLYFPNTFLVFVSNAASKDFDGDAFWKNLFEKIGIDSQSVQLALKRAFCQGIKDKGMPCFTAEDNDFHFLYTALLHGGFSESFWRPMWSDVVLPYSKDLALTWLARRSGSELLRSMKSGACRLELQREYAKRIIEKAPSAMLETLLDSALAVASDLNDSEESYSGFNGSFEMLSTHGLPEAAMQALRDVLENDSSSPKRFVYLPTAEMRLDPANGRVHLHWDAQKLPPHFAGRSIEYRVNGRLERTAAFVMSVGKCLLPELVVSLPPSDRFDVELSLLDADGDNTPLATLSQTFDRTRPGSFEFVQGADEVFRLRKKLGRIDRTRCIAFLTKAGLQVVPGLGMKPVERYEADWHWNGASIQLFEVDPGSSGSIVNTLTGDEVACWQENYRVEIDRTHVIGKSYDKRDLYGFSYSRIGTNDCLPEISIETLNTATVRSDLDIRCECDGERISLPWGVCQDAAGHESGTSGRLIIKPSEAILIDMFVRRGQISVFQKSSGTPILNYKFSIVPIRCFGIEEMFWDSGTPWATYTFEALAPIVVPSSDGDYEMLRHDRFYFDAPLEAQRSHVAFRNVRDDAALEVELNLAGIELSVPHDLVETSSKRPVCSSDADSIDGRIRLESNGRRQSRAIYASMGSIPLLYKQLRGSAIHSLDIFKDPTRLVSDGSEERRDVEITVSYGDRLERGKAIPASASLRLVRCTTGFGLGSPSLRRKPDGLCLCFENCAPVDLEVRFLDRRGKKELGVAEIGEGQSFVAIPKDAVYQLDVRRTVVVQILALDIFGEVDEGMLMKFELTR